MFMVESTTAGVKVLDRLQNVESPRGLPLFDVSFTNVQLNKDALLGKSKDMIAVVVVFFSFTNVHLNKDALLRKRKDMIAVACCAGKAYCW